MCAALCVCRAVSSCTACVRACDTVTDSPTVLLVPNLVLPQQQLLLAGAIPRLAGGGHEILAELPQPIGHHLGQCVQHMCRTESHATYLSLICSTLAAAEPVAGKVFGCGAGASPSGYGVDRITDNGTYDEDD